MGWGRAASPPPTTSTIQRALDSHGDSSWKHLSPGLYREQLCPCRSLPCLQRKRSRKARRKRPEFSSCPGLLLRAGVPIPIHAKPGWSLTRQQLPASFGSCPGTRGGIGERTADQTKRGLQVQLSTSKAATCPQAAHPHGFEHSQGCDSTTTLGSLCQGLTTLFMRKFSLISNLKLPWCCFLTLVVLGISVLPHSGDTTCGIRA